MSQTNKQKKTYTIQLSSFCVGHLLLCWDLPLSVVIISTETPLEKTNFSFTGRNQLEICPWLGMGV